MNNIRYRKDSVLVFSLFITFLSILRGSFISNGTYFVFLEIHGEQASALNFLANLKSLFQICQVKKLVICWFLG